MNSIQIDRFELDDHICYDAITKKNFRISEHFCIHSITDSFAKSFDLSLKDVYDNRMWAQRRTNLVNINRLATELLEPLIKIIDDQINIKIGILATKFIKKFQLGRNCLFWFGKAILFRPKHINTFEAFLKITSSDLKFGEVVYFSATNFIYITLPIEVMKGVVRIR